MQLNASFARFTPLITATRTLVALSAFTLALVPRAADAQTRGGVIAGASITKVTGTATGSVCDPEAGCVSSSTSNRVGFQVGGYLQVPINRMWSFQPELHFIQKGGKTAVSISDGFEDPFSAELELRLAYLEVPALLRLDVGSGRVRPFLVAGPTVAYRVGCEVAVSVDQIGNISTPCDEGEPFDDSESGSIEDPIKKFDAGGIVGGGVTGMLGGRVVSAQVRYSRGFISVARESDGPTARNTGVSVLFSFGF